MKRRYAGNGEAFFDEMIAVPLVLIADKAEEIIHDSTAGGGDLNLLKVGHGGQNYAGSTRVFSRTSRWQFGYPAGLSKRQSVRLGSDPVIRSRM